MSDEIELATNGWAIQQDKPIEPILSITPEGRVVAGPGLEMDEAAERFLRACSVYVQRLEAERDALRASLAVHREAAEAFRGALEGPWSVGIDRRDPYYTVPAAAVDAWDRA